MTEGSRKVFEYVKANYGTELTKQHIADALGVSLSTVTGSVNSLVKKGLCVERIEELPVEEGKRPTYLRYLSMTDAGVAYDPDEEEARLAQAKLEERAAKKAARAAEKEAAKAAKEMAD